MILMEKEILTQIAKRLNFGENHGATLAPGGSMTNMMALIMARDKKAPEVRFEGLQNKMTLYTSTESHYSVPKNASFAGIGRNQIRFIPTNDNGQMSVEELDLGRNWIEDEFYSFKGTVRRMFSLGGRVRYLLPMLVLNASYRQYIKAFR